MFYVPSDRRISAFEINTVSGLKAWGPTLVVLGVGSPQKMTAWAPPRMWDRRPYDGTSFFLDKENSKFQRR